MKRKHFLLALVALVVALAAAAYMFRAPVLTGMGEFLVVTTPLQKADIIVALGGSKERRQDAVELLREGVAPRVMFTGNDVDKKDYQCEGITEEATILPPGPSYSTYDDANVVLKAAEENNFRSVIIVTSPYHLRRSGFIFHEVFKGRRVNLMFHASRIKAFQMDKWWKSYIGRKLVLKEYMGLVYYWVKY
ncbi:MAG TPA: YdcF family protein [Nitrospirae bacterium]|nr:YdcF family protein [Nitrospirota bacterium]